MSTVSAPIPSAFSMLYPNPYLTVTLRTWKYFADVINVFNMCKGFCIKIIMLKIFFFFSSECFKTLAVCQDLERKQQAADQSTANIQAKCIITQVSLCQSVLHPGSEPCLETFPILRLVPFLAIWIGPSNGLYLASRCSPNQQLHGNLLSSA